MALATTADIQARLARTLTDAEAAQAALLIPLAEGLVEEACGKPAGWAAALTPVPAALRLVVIEAVVRVVANPAGLRSRQEQLGAFSHSESFTAQAAGLALTDTEERLARRTVHGAGTASVKTGAIIDEYLILEGACPGS